MPSYSGLYNGVYNENYAPQSQLIAKGNAANALSRLFANRLYGRASTRELLVTLIGAATGQTANMTHRRVKSEANRSENMQGGLRQMETFTTVNRVTTATDVSMFITALEQSTKPPYAVDRSGSAGGGKLGY